MRSSSPLAACQSLARLLSLPVSDPLFVVGKGDGGAAPGAIEPQRLRAGFHVPEAHGVVGGGGKHLLAVGEEDARGGQKLVPFFEVFQFAARADIPGFGRAVAAGRGDRLAVGSKVGRQDGVGMPFEQACLQHALFLVAFDVPQLGQMVVAARQHPMTVSRWDATADPAGMAAHGLERFAGMDVPDPQSIVVAAAEQQPTVARKSDTAHRCAMPFQGAERQRRIGFARIDLIEVERFHVLRFPDQHPFVVSAAGHRAAIRRKDG